MYRIYRETEERGGGKGEKDLSTTWNKCNRVSTYTNIYTTDCT